MTPRTILTLIATVAILGTVGVAPASAAARRAIPCPQFGAHRGEGWPAQATGDSSKAVQAAIDDPTATFLESDVWATSDGLGLMQHSSTLADTDGTGNVADFTLADIQGRLHMKDGTSPQSLPEFLAQVVGARKHAILHDKSPSIDPYIDEQLRVAHAHAYVRVMVDTLTRVRFFAARGWIVEYTPPPRAPKPTEVAAAKAAGAAAVLIVDTTRRATPSNRLQPWINAHVLTDYVTYSRAQDDTARQYAISRLMSGNVTQSRAVEGCAA